MDSVGNASWLPPVILETVSDMNLSHWFLPGVLAGWLPVMAAEPPPVTWRESAKTFFLDNGLLSVRIEKSSGDVFSIRYRGQELLAQTSEGGALGGYWSAVGRIQIGSERLATVRIDPATNGGDRVEVACQFRNPPGQSNAPLDVEVRYALGRGESGLYTYLIWTHRPGYPAFGVAEARFCAKLNPDVFDFMTIDAARRRIMPTPEDWDRGAPLNLSEARRMTTGRYVGQAEHKYGYSAVIHEIPAYGWSSTKHQLGLWFVNPSFEYMAGGPTKVELTGHLDVNRGGTPTLLNMWLGSHYGGSSLAVAAGESWSKVVGPFLIYCNSTNGAARRTSGDAVDAGQHDLWQDALAQARREARRWPYEWVQDVDYPRAAGRGAVSGRVTVRDPFDSQLRWSNMWVGVTAPDYVPSGGRPGMGAAPLRATNAGERVIGRGGFPVMVDWQRDAKYYQFWTPADAEGRFYIPQVRPGRYTLRVFADGIIGEAAQEGVQVHAGQTNQLGGVRWQPVRFGRTLWQIGVPDRTAREFRNGDRYWQWGQYFNYPREFPNDVNFIIGRSDWRRDWNYVQPPRIETGAVTPVSEADELEDSPQLPARLGRDAIRPTTWTIQFDHPRALRGRATLRLAFCGTHQGCNVVVGVNGTEIGETGLLPSTSAMQRDGIRAFWIEKCLSFDAALLRRGQNRITLHSPAQTWSQGVMYDCVRLEVDERP
jgi:rhamnogalacturonan endolyase